MKVFLLSDSTELCMIVGECNRRLSVVRPDAAVTDILISVKRRLYPKK